MKMSYSNSFDQIPCLVFFILLTMIFIPNMQGEVSKIEPGEVTGSVLQSGRNVVIAITSKELCAIAQSITSAVAAAPIPAEKISEAVLRDPPACEVVLTFVEKDGGLQKPVRYFAIGSHHIKSDNGLYYAFDYGPELIAILSKRIQAGLWKSLEH